MKRFLRVVYQPYKLVFVIPFMILSTLVHGVIIIFLGFVLGRGAGNIVAVSWSKLACLVGPVGVKIRGRDNYDTQQSYVVVANHLSMVDIPVLHGWLGLKIKWIMKKELKKVPVFGRACEALGCIFIDRSDTDAAIGAMKDAKKRLGPKASVLFFPEGTRSRGGSMLPFKKGAFRFAIYAGLPILPVTVRNSHRILPSDSLDLFPGTAEVIVHPSVDLGRHALDDLDGTISEIRGIIKASL